MITDEEIEKVRKSANIVDIISSYIPLTQKGKNYFGVCPFHEDHSPSMSVSEEKQIYKCFVCGEGGNVITFIQKYKKKSSRANKTRNSYSQGSPGSQSTRYYFYNPGKTFKISHVFWSEGLGIFAFKNLPSRSINMNRGIPLQRIASIKLLSPPMCTWIPPNCFA